LKRALRTSWPAGDFFRSLEGHSRTLAHHSGGPPPGRAPSRRELGEGGHRPPCGTRLRGSLYGRTLGTQAAARKLRGGVYPLGRLRGLTVLIHAFDMRGSALAGPVPRPLHDFESSARRTDQNPSVVVRRERDRHVVLGRDPVAQLGHVHSVPRIHNVETSIGCGGAGRSTGSSGCDKRSLPEGRRCPNRRLRRGVLAGCVGIQTPPQAGVFFVGNAPSTHSSSCFSPMTAHSSKCGRKHQNERRRWQSEIDAGRGVCATCGGPIDRQTTGH
jgi:hypothetical protein